MRYVFVCPDIDFIKLQYSDFEKLAGGMVLFGKSRHIFKMIGLFRNPTISKMARKFAFSSLEREFGDIDRSERCCFVVYARAYESYKAYLTDFLKQSFPGCIVVVYYGDLVSRHSFEIEEAKKDADYVFSFDEKDSMEYDIPWLLEPFSESIVYMDDFSEANNPIKWDVTFVGHAKNRYNKILELYEELVKSGLKVDFHITGVPKDQRKYTDDISYNPLSFRELLRHVVSSKCVAEVLQNDGVSPTTRYTEALVFSRILLTDCIFFAEGKDAQTNVIYYDSVIDIGEKLKSKLMENLQTDELKKHITDFSIPSMIDSIEKHIKNIEVK